MNEDRTIVLDEDAERRLWRKIAFRIIPLVGIAYVISDPSRYFRRVPLKRRWNPWQQDQSDTRQN